MKEKSEEKKKAELDKKNRIRFREVHNLNNAPKTMTGPDVYAYEIGDIDEFREDGSTILPNKPPCGHVHTRQKEIFTERAISWLNENFILGKIAMSTLCAVYIRQTSVAKAGNGISHWEMTSKINQVVCRSNQEHVQRALAI